MKTIIILLIILLSTSIFASGFGVGIGAYNLGTTDQSGTDGGSATFSFHPGISLDAVMQIGGKHFFNPEFGYVYFRSADDDYGEQSKRTIYMLLDLGYAFTSNVILRYGGGLFMTKIGGDGGAVTVRNGETGTTTAYKPEETITSYNTTFDLGVDLAITKSFNFRFETYMFNPLSSTRRAVYYSASLHTFF